MADIPDDVVERALDAWFGDLGWKHDKSLGIDAASSDGWRKERMRAAGRVFVEWEREQAATRIEHSLCDVAEDESVFAALRTYFAARVRSRSTAP